MTTTPDIRQQWIAGGSMRVLICLILFTLAGCTSMEVRVSCYAEYEKHGLRAGTRADYGR